MTIWVWQQHWERWVNSSHPRCFPNWKCSPAPTSALNLRKEKRQTTCVCLFSSHPGLKATGRDVSKLQTAHGGWGVYPLHSRVTLIHIVPTHIGAIFCSSDTYLRIFLRMPSIMCDLVLNDTLHQSGSDRMGKKHHSMSIPQLWSSHPPDLPKSEVSRVIGIPGLA